MTHPRLRLLERRKSDSGNRISVEAPVLDCFEEVGGLRSYSKKKPAIPWPLPKRQEGKAVSPSLAEKTLDFFFLDDISAVKHDFLPGNVSRFL